MANLEKLKKAVFAMNDRACFIERDRILAQLRPQMEGYEKPDKYARIFAKLMEQVSTPVDAADYFAGRLV